MIDTLINLNIWIWNIIGICVGIPIVVGLIFSVLFSIISIIVGITTFPRKIK